MKKSVYWRSLVAATVLGITALYLIPGLLTFTVPGSERKEAPALVQKLFPDSRINLGLDLLGGIHLTLGVEVAKAVESSLAQSGNDIAQAANKGGMLMARPRLLQGETLEFFLTVPEKRAALDEMLAKQFPEFEYTRTEAAGSIRYTATLTAKAKTEMEDRAIDLALNTIRNRIDQFGVAEPDVRRQQDGRIIIQLPGMDSTQRAISIIGKTAHLEFRIVRDDVDPRALVAPPGVEFLPMAVQEPGAPERRLPVDREVALTGESITNAQAFPDTQQGGYLVSISFDRRGSDIFARVTRDNLKKRLAIILDGKIHSAPVLQVEITGGQAQITGDFSLIEANDLALVLRAGSLPAPVTVLEERTVGPSLGQESIEAGVTAALAGCALVMVFVTAYYGISGIIANLMLLLDVAMILAGMALFGATLTLPGIAGIVLTLGMAIDANVLIFERIREEIKAGRTAVEAVAEGFHQAQRAIIDSNLTSIIATVVLYQLGSGPVRGFAVTLTLGILASMFTAIFVSHIVFDIWMSKPGRKLSI